MHLILTGATGLVGTSVLDAMIKMTDVTKISILSRRPVQMADDARDPRINVIIHKDFETYDSELLNKLRDASGCVWALGISQAQVDKEYVFLVFFSSLSPYQQMDSRADGHALALPHQPPFFSPWDCSQHQPPLTLTLMKSPESQSQKQADNPKQRVH